MMSPRGLVLLAICWISLKPRENSATRNNVVFCPSLVHPSTSFRYGAYGRVYERICSRVKESELLLRAAYRFAGEVFRGELQQEGWMTILGFRNNNDSSKANKHFPQPPDPDVLMRQMDRSIAALEYQRATIQLSKYPPPQPAPSKSSDNGKALRAKDESAMLARGT